MFSAPFAVFVLEQHRVYPLGKGPAVWTDLVDTTAVDLGLDLSGMRREQENAVSDPHRLGDRVGDEDDGENLASISSIRLRSMRTGTMSVFWGALCRLSAAISFWRPSSDMNKTAKASGASTARRPRSGARSMRRLRTCAATALTYFTSIASIRVFRSRAPSARWPTS